MDDASLEKFLEQGRALAGRGQLTAAERVFDRALAAEPLCAFALFYRAGIRLARGAAAAAAQDFAALERVPLGELIRHRELDNLPPSRYPGLLPALRRLARRRPGLVWARLMSSFLLRSLLRNDEAEAEMEAAVRAAPEVAAMRAFLGRARMVHRSPEKGARDLEHAVALESGVGWLHAWLGEARRRQGRLEEALACLERALARDRGYALAYVWRGAVLRGLGRIAEALRDLDFALGPLRGSFRDDGERASFVNTTLAWAHHQRFLCRRELGDAVGALDDLEEAHGRNPRYRWADRDATAALPELDRLVRALPRDPRARVWRGLARLDAGDPASALADFEEAVGLGESVAAYVGRGRALLGSGDPAAGLESFEEALRRDGGSAEAHLWRGAALRDLGRLAEACRSLERAGRLDPVSAPARAWRGEILLRRGRTREAMAALEDALAIHPDYEDARALRARALKI